MQQITELVTNEDLIMKVPGTLNPADLATRTKVRLSDIEEGSQWQEGPSFLKTPRETWPLTITGGESSVPPEECKL